MGATMAVGVSGAGAGAGARRVFNADMVERLHAVNEVSRRLRALGFEVGQEWVLPPDGGAPMIALRAVSEEGQQCLLGIVRGTVFHTATHLRTAVLGGTRLAWQGYAQ